MDVSVVVPVVWVAVWVVWVVIWVASWVVVDGGCTVEVAVDDDVSVVVAVVFGGVVVGVWGTNRDT